MARMKPVTPDQASGDLKPIYAALEKNLGKVINIFQMLGNSPAALAGFLAFSESANKTSLSSKLREQIALAVGQANACQYCLSAHSVLGAKAGLSSQQIIEARQGHAPDKKTEAILQFVKTVVEKRAHVADSDVAKLKEAGVSDAELAEIVLVISINLFTNYFNLIAGTPVDFPEAPQIGPRNL